MRCIFVLAITSICLLSMIGCSGSSEVVTPEDNRPAIESVDNHNLWGLWQFTADVEKQTLDVVPVRMGEMHLNAMRYLEPPMNLYLRVENIQFTGNVLDLDMVLRNPFLDLDQYTGFDTCGILIGYGSVTGFDDTDIAMPGDGDTRLLNPDGYTRWWNPVEFPHTSTTSGYQDGLLGTPDDIAEFTATLNGYKFYCDDLTTPVAPLNTVDPASRCVLSAGQSNSRHFTIEIAPGGLVFNYAVDMNWEFPEGSSPWDVPDDFGPGANRTEAWNINITEFENTLWNDGEDNGGDLSLLIDVWDHFDADLNTVKVESPGNFGITSSATPVGSGVGYNTYCIAITDATPIEGSIDLLITVESEAVGYQDLLPGKTVSAYFTHAVEVDDEEPSPADCGTGNHGPLVPAPLTDLDVVARHDTAWLVNGPYEGEMLASGWNGTVNELRRYNTDTIGPLSASLFTTLSLAACPPPPDNYPPFIFHIEVEPVTGRVIVVPFGPEPNNSLHVFDNQGNQLTPDTGISVGPGRRISAMGTNENGDIWLISSFQLNTDTGDDCRLQRWEYQSGAPYYAHNPSYDLELDEIMGYYHNTYGYVVRNWIVDLVVLYPEQRILVWNSASSGQHKGRLDLFDINACSPPTYLPDLSTENLLSFVTWNVHSDFFSVACAAISVDHADDTLDGCRVSVFSLCMTPESTKVIMLGRLDRDGNILNETNFGTGPYLTTMGINYDPDPTKANLVFLANSPSNCRMAAPPVDW